MITVSTLSPDDIQDLVTKAFALEAITDKPGCTTRYQDLPGKPLPGFVIAGINTGRYFRQFAANRLQGSTLGIYGYGLDALQNSNRHKSPKYINFGLLEIMFPTVAARLATDDARAVIDTILSLIKTSKQADVAHLMDMRTMAWSTSQTVHKAAFTAEKYMHHNSVWDLYMALYADYPLGNSNHEWAGQFQRGLPILRSFFATYLEAGEVLDSTKQIFLKERAANPDVAVGILADMCAVAIFLWLSFTDAPA